MNIHSFGSQSEQIEAIIQRIHHSILQILKVKSNVTIAVSGGNSPIPLFNKLSQVNLPWNKINITLVDERIVDPSSPDSNEHLVRKYLLKNSAINANFIGIISPADSTKKLINGFNIDIAILGMGEDGHTASIFPDCKEYNQAIDLNNEYGYIVTRPISAKHERLSMTLSHIIQVPELILNISGAIKFNVLNESVRNTDYPIHYLIKARDDLQVYYVV